MTNRFEDALKIAKATQEEVKEMDFGEVFWACGILAQQVEVITKERDELELQVDALTAKLKCQIACGCSYDRPDDICMAHLPIMEQLRKERDKLAKGILSFNSDAALLELVEKAKKIRGEK